MTTYHATQLASQGTVYTQVSNAITSLTEISAAAAQAEALWRSGDHFGSATVSKQAVLLLDQLISTL